MESLPSSSLSPGGRGLGFLRASLHGKVSGKEDIKYLSLFLVLCDQGPKPIQEQAHFSPCFLSAVDVKAPLVALCVLHHTQLDFGFAEPIAESTKANFLIQLISRTETL